MQGTSDIDGAKVFMDVPHFQSCQDHTSLTTAALITFSSFIIHSFPGNKNHTEHCLI